MARKIGFGGQGDPTRAGLVRRLIPHVILETIGIAVLIYGILANQLTAAIIGGAWVAVMVVFTMIAILKYVAEHQATERDEGNS